MKVQEKLLPTERNVVITLSGIDLHGKARNLPRLNFQLYFLRDVPVFTFQFEASDIIVFPVNFHTLDFWPVIKNLIISIRLTNADGSPHSGKDIVLSQSDSTRVCKAILEQQNSTAVYIGDLVESVHASFANSYKRENSLIVSS
jgi:hypothetical protein